MTTNVVKRPVVLPVQDLEPADSVEFSRTMEEFEGEKRKRRFPASTHPMHLQSPTSDQRNNSPTCRASLPPDYLNNNLLASNYSATTTTKSHKEQDEEAKLLANTDRFSNCSTSSGCSSASSSFSSISTNECGSPSLILPYLYVGNQAQTQIDTISNLDISYVLSLQSLPKFLDQDEADNSEQVVTSTTADSNCQKAQIAAATMNDEPSEGIPTMETSELMQNEADAIDDEKELPLKVDRAGILPLVNSSKDYLVKISSSVNRLIKGKCINISDTFEQLVDKFFDETHNFIEEARRNRCNVLIHCKAGISRSPTIAIAYLMKWKRLHLHEAYNFVKRCRPQISPNLNFMGQLVHYERQILNCANSNRLPSPASSCLAIPPVCLTTAPTTTTTTTGTKATELKHDEGNYNSHKHSHDRIRRPSSLFLPATSTSSQLL